MLTEMLDVCANGWSWKLLTHSRAIYFNGKTYPTLPKHDEIAVGHIRQMIRHLSIPNDCAKKHIQILG
jgi:hypothetical protein